MTTAELQTIDENNVALGLDAAKQETRANRFGMRDLILYQRRDLLYMYCLSRGAPEYLLKKTITNYSVTNVLLRIE